MRRIMSGSQMKAVDRVTIEEIGIPSAVLMERAAFEAYDVSGEYIKKGDRVLVVCGTGNNGGDGLAFARMLRCGRGIVPDVFIAGNSKKGSDDFKLQADITLKGLGCPQIESLKTQKDAILKYDVVVDAVFGTGLSRDVEGEYAKLIDLINDFGRREGKTVISIDIPSGINADTGVVMGRAVEADVTVTFGALKAGLAVYPGAAHAGRVFVRDIGFPDEAYDKKPFARAIEDEDLKNIPERDPASNKGTYGKVLVVAGSGDTYGAAYLCALSALRCGAGMVKVYTSRENKNLINKMLPEAMVATYGDSLDLSDYAAALEWADVIVIGCGIGTGDLQRELVKGAMRAGKTTVIDADALNCISGCPQLSEYFHEKCIITPHVGEMFRLTGIKASRIKETAVLTAKKYAEEHSVTCVLKDARTVIAARDGECFINMNGNDGMSTAGSGDVLAGVIASLAGCGMNPFEAAAYGVFIHAKAGDLAAAETGRHGLIAGDIIKKAADIFKNLEESD